MVSTILVHVCKIAPYKKITSQQHMNLVIKKQLAKGTKLKRTTKTLKMVGQMCLMLHCCPHKGMNLINGTLSTC
jgi:hypothetical protein